MHLFLYHFPLIVLVGLILVKYETNNGSGRYHHWVDRQTTNYQLMHVSKVKQQAWHWHCLMTSKGLEVTWDV